MCDVESDDIWVKIKMMIEADQNFVESELEVRVEKNINCYVFQKVIQKLLLQIWNEYC